MTDVCRPQNLDEYVGQEKLKARLRVMVEAALFGRRRLPHLLLTAPPGTGKTSLAHVLADQVGDPLHKLAMPADVKALERIVANETGVLFLDEIQEAPRLIQARLLGLLEFGALPTARGDVIANPELTVIGATTDPGMIRPALYERFVVPSFEPYTAGQMAAIVRSMAAKAGIEMSDDTAMCLARASNGAPRYALRLVEAAWELTESLFGIEPDVESILTQAGFTADGLTEAHLDYLDALGMLDGAGLSLLARHLRLDKGVCMDLERLLISHCLIDYSGQGRRLTQAGRRRLQDHQEAA